MLRAAYRALLFTCASFLVGMVQAQELTRILFVFDASNSMSGFWENEPKINTAVDLLSQSVDELAGTPDLETALRVYGHQTRYVPGKQDCEDTELVVPFSKENNLIIKKALKGIQPMGTTPIARSLLEAANDFPACTDCRNVIILITDGLEACDEDPCAASKALQEKGITLKPFVIGIGGTDEFLSVFDCVGKYYDASNTESFKRVLDVVLAQALNNTTIQIDLLNEAGENTVSDMPFSLYDQRTGEKVYHFVHALNEKGNPDTIALDPTIDYRLKVHTFPPLEKSNIELAAGKHQHVSLKAATGTLAFSFPKERDEYGNLQVLVRKKDDCEWFHLQDFSREVSYLTGAYDIEISTLPPTRIEDVQIIEGEQASIVIPEPGVLNMVTSKRGFGGVFLKSDQELEKVLSIEGERPPVRIKLQPGLYTLVFRSEDQAASVYTIEKTFEITSGKPTSVQF